MHIAACKNTQLIIDFSGEFVLMFFPFVIVCLPCNSLIWGIACSSVISRGGRDGHCWLSTPLFPAPESSAEHSRYPMSAYWSSHVMWNPFTLLDLDWPFISEIYLHRIHKLISMLSSSVMETVSDKARSMVVHLIGCCVVGSAEMKNGEHVRSPTLCLLRSPRT